MIPQSYLDSLNAHIWRANLTSIEQNGFLLSDKSRYVAVVSVSAARDCDMPGWGEIRSIYIQPDSYRKGYGKILFSHAEEQLKQDGFDKIYLWVLEKNLKARSFYEAMGFHPNGDIKDVRFDDTVLRELRYTNI